jgi:DNA polymerase-4
VASSLDKPGGLAVITPDQVEEFLEDLEIGEFHGIGEATERKMKKMGIDTGRDLKELSEYELVEAFGKAGRHYYRIVRGIDPREVKTHRIRKSIGKENTFNEDIDDLSWLKQYLETQSQKVAERAQRIDAAGKTVTVKVRYADFETITRSSTFAGYIDQAEELAEAAKSLVEETEAGGRSVRLIGVTLSNLNLQEEQAGIQLDLFKDQDSPES